jgi:hypothetical protein
LLAEILATDPEELQTDARPIVVEPSAVQFGSVTTVGAFYGAVVPWSWWYYDIDGFLEERFFPGSSDFWSTEYDGDAWGYGDTDRLNRNHPAAPRSRPQDRRPRRSTQIRAARRRG